MVVETMVIETANPAQLEAWNGEEGASWAQEAERYERSGIRRRSRILAAIETGDQVLDIGCGTGRTTIEAARTSGPDGGALGVDLSGPMLEHARVAAAAEGVTNASFLHADAQIHPFDPASFDVAISDTGGMFFGDPKAAYTNIARALRSGGRLAILVWRELARNEWISKVRESVALGRELPTPPPDAPGHPFSFADPERVRPILVGAGFVDLDFAAVDEPMVLGIDAADAYDFIGRSNLVQWLLEDVDEAGREVARNKLRATFEAAETSEGVLLGSSAWLISATRS